MRAWSSALAVACLVLGVGLAAPAQSQVRPSPAPSPGGGGGGQPQGQPQAQGNTFTFKVCNKSRTTLYVSMLYKVDGNSWRMVGWAEYKGGQCAPIRGTYPKVDFFWYAEDAPGKITYSGKDAQACVNPRDSFDRTISGDYQCRPGEKIVGFTRINEQAINDGITLID
ncbi:MAG: DUF1036 domain-containing protein [Xanthobacteraceae bacterium]